MVSAELCTNTGRTTRESNTMKTPRIIVWALIAYCVFVLVIGMARADAVIPPLMCGTGPEGTSSGHGPLPQAMIDRLEQQGVDVTEVREALQNGNTEAVKAWLEAYHDAHPDDMMRGPRGMDPEKLKKFRQIKPSQINNMFRRRAAPTLEMWRNNRKKLIMFDEDKINQ